MALRRYISSDGYSMVELLVVGSVLVVLAAMSVPYALNFSKRYKTEDQAIKVMDLMQEAAQLAMNRRRTVRLEINLNDNTLKITDENGTDPDFLVKSVPLEPVNEVRMDVAPIGVTLPGPPNYPLINFGTPRTWTVKFKSDGSVVNMAGTTPVSATLYLWPPKKVPYDPSNLEPRSRNEVRAITLFGGSGAVRYWKHNGTTFVPYQ